MRNLPIEPATMSTALDAQWTTLSHTVSGLSEQQWRTSSPLPGWTVFDVLAHVVGIESMLLGEPNPDIDAGVRTRAHVRNDIGALNEAWLDTLRPLTGTQLADRFDSVTARRRTALTALDETGWQQSMPSPVGVVPYVRFMRTRVFDCWMHELDITDALGLAPSGPAAELRGDLALDELEAGIGRTVVKRGGAPDGLRLDFELTGPNARTVHVRVEGRGEVVATPDRPADTVIRLDARLFARLCGGRVAAEAELDRIELSGDRATALRIVHHLAFTI
ncbi:maleylpyruvate isomerase family mycothiol-dependent enzyme [Nocardia sp. alder85J]|uniref:maleylpyruvate isomerase family mycothiol-dependent enzyme n=1 Tax=Nocardia sp. alder85J TaxID=2862949 RepID=UPI001CD73668|nr:maleylpyruvate isomerase family mycothiol-dependent enzyme [Nocardia sp. alder85J]MCX4097312.1 maleylpyruvate isomerase family mycothiol-dependent enzyme [Nocardia sp. alder85J]